MKKIRYLLGTLVLGLVLVLPIKVNAQTVSDSMYGQGAHTFTEKYGMSYSSLRDDYYATADNATKIRYEDGKIKRVFEDTTLVWTDHFTYNFVINGITYTMEVPADEDVLTWIYQPTMSGYTFVGWKDNTTPGNDVLTTLISEEGGSHTLYPVFKRTLTVTLVGGASNVTNTADQYYCNGVNASSIVTFTNNSTRSGYDLLGYRTDKTANATVQYQASESYSFAGDTTLYAVFQAPATTVTIKTGGTDIVNTGRPLYNNGNTTNAQIKLGTASLSGWTLKGYRTDTTASSSVSYVAGNTYSFSENTTLYAVYTASRDVTATKYLTLSTSCQTGGTMTLTTSTSSPTQQSVVTHWYYTEVKNVGNSTTAKENSSKPSVNIAGTWNFTQATAGDAYTGSNIYPSFGSGSLALYIHYTWAGISCSNCSASGLKVTASHNVNYDSANITATATGCYSGSYYMTGTVQNVSTTQADHFEGWFPTIPNAYTLPSQKITFTVHNTVTGYGNVSVISDSWANWAAQIKPYTWTLTGVTNLGYSKFLGVRRQGAGEEYGVTYTMTITVGAPTW